MGEDDIGSDGARSGRASAKPLWREVLSVPEILTSGPGMMVAAGAAPTGASRPVLVIPGFVTGDITTLPLRAFLRSLGHRPSGWGLGVNVGVAAHIAVGLDRMLVELAHRHGTTIDIVGWSAGGIMGRLLALHRTELVGQVISLGSPIELRPTDHNLGPIQAVTEQLFVTAPPHLDVHTIPVPSTTIWTDGDGVVPGRLCSQAIDERSESIEVRGTHMGLGTNPAALLVVADRLAQARPWRPFVPPRRLRWWYPSIDNHQIGSPDLPPENPRESCTS